MTLNEVELALAYYLDYRKHYIVPNVSWGLGVHECDILSVTKHGYATEYEIKLYRSDVIADKKKRHKHESKKIKYLYFVIPEDLYTDDVVEHIPDRAGIIVVYQHSTSKSKYCRKTRPAKQYKHHRKLTDNEVKKLLHLGTIRIWSLKEKLGEHYAST